MNPSTALATALVDELVRCGVREAVLCPGSRSAPLAYALEAAEREGRLRLHVRVDERSAAFLALGLAKVSRVPAVVVTTSGTAVANLHPAVLEAHHAAVPLIVLSADRPAELLGTGANQTTRQPGIFGDAVRWATVLTTPGDGAGEPATSAYAENGWWRSSACRAHAAATGALGTTPGPVHVDVQLRDPLVPGAERCADRVPGRPGGRPWVAVPTSPPAPGGTGPADGPSRTLVVLGDLPVAADSARAVRWARERGWPVVAEPFGGHDRREVVPAGSLLLTDADWVDRHRPERVVTVGRITLSRHVAAVLRHPGTVVETVAPTGSAAGWTDPSHVVSAVHPLSVLDAPAPDPAATGWREAWHDAGARLVSALATDPAPFPSGLAVAATVLTSVPAGAVLFAASSNAARDLDLAPVDPVAVARDLTVVASRGLAGIDGTLATASGVALAGAGAPAYLLVGDLAFLHDSGALAIGPGEPRPDLTVVVVNDDGGGIFGLLEPGDPARTDLAARFDRLFGTPTGTDLAPLCAAHRVPHLVADSAQALADQLRAAPDGLRVVEVRVARDGHREVHAELRERARHVLTADRQTTERGRR